MPLNTPFITVNNISTRTGLVSTSGGNSNQWNSTFTTVNSNSANWNSAYTTGTVYQSNSASYATINFTNSKFLPLTGGTLTGSLSVNSLSVDRILVTQLDALSANITVIDIKQYELSGFNVTGDVTINGTVSAGNLSAGDINAANARFSGNLTVDTNTLFVNAANDRVGIGTTTPTFKLQLSGASTLGIDTAGSEPAIVGGASGISLKVSSGAVSIFRGLDGWAGTWKDSAPTTYFQVGRASGNTMFSSLLGQSFNRLSFTVSNTTNNGVVFTTEASSLSSPVGYFEIRQGSTPNFLVQKTTGNIGIGTSTPNEKLTVVGNISATGIVTAEGNKLATENFAVAMAIALG